MRIRAAIAVIATLSSTFLSAPPAQANTWILIYQTTNTQRDANQNAIYSADYERNGAAPTGSSSTFDYDDSAAPGANGLGTFQLHNLTDTQTVLAWNRSRFNDTAELGFGPCMSGAASTEI